MKVWFLFFVLLGFSAFGQEKEPEQKDDLKIGLVLSGGGAKGLAHIGALKVIDDAGIDIDYIAGTSMGAIVGSLYASGYTPHQLDSIFNKTNFRTLLGDDIPRGVKNFYQKEDAERYALTLPFDDFKISFPSGLSKGQNIYNLMAQMMAPVNSGQNGSINSQNDFKNLPIPFFCIATNVETGEEVTLNSGSLPQAVSASGAIPSFFSPVNIDGDLFIDGGVTNNYPIEKLKAKGVDFIIGVDVQDSLVNRKKLNSAFSILTQVNNFRTVNDMKTKRGLTDLYIAPDINKFSVLSFKEGKEIINRGEDAAREQLKRLLLLADRQAPQKHPKKHRKVPEHIKINKIEIKGNTAYPRNYIRGKLKIPTKSTIDYADLNRGIENLVATGNFKRVEYDLKKAEGDSYDIEFTIHENQNNTRLKFSLHYDRLYKSSALVNMTSKSLLFTNDIASIDIIGGDNFRYDMSYYIDKGEYWSIGLNHSLDQFTKDVGFDFVRANSSFENNAVNQVEINYLDVKTQLYLETLFLNNFKLGIGIEQDYSEIETNTIFPADRPEDSDDKDIPAVLENSNLYSGFTYIKYDSYDNAYFPREGFKFDGNFHLYLFDSGSSYDFSQFSMVDGNLGYAVSPLSYLSLRVEGGAGFSIGNKNTNALNFFLGGYGNNYVNNLHSFLGYEHLGLSGDSYIKSKFELDFQPFPKNHLKLMYNLANVGDELFESTKWIEEVNYTGFGVGYGLETIAGPLEVIYSYSPERGTSEWFLSLGFWF